MTEQNYRTVQESFWAGDFGSEYITRNQNPELIAANIAMFGKALKGCGKITSVLEFGSNIGLNLLALRELYPNQRQYAIEINSSAVQKLRAALPNCGIFETSILDFDTSNFSLGPVDLVFTKGVLIHINPEMLEEVYKKLINLSRRYILICEYFNPTPVSMHYRGHSDRLFKRDFAGEILALNKNLTLQDYGFIYHADPSFPQDDLTWFLIRKGT